MQIVFARLPDWFQDTYIDFNKNENFSEIKCCLNRFLFARGRKLKYF